MEYIAFFFIYTIVGFTVSWFQYYLLKENIYSYTDEFIIFAAIWPATLIITIFFIWYGTEEKSATPSPSTIDKEASGS